MVLDHQQTMIFSIGKNANSGKKSSLNIRRTLDFIVISFNDIVLDISDNKLLDQKYLLNQNFLSILSSDASHLRKEKRIGHFSYESEYVSMHAIIQKNVFDSFLIKLENGNKEYLSNLKFRVVIEKYKSKKNENYNSFEVKNFEIIYNKEI